MTGASALRRAIAAPIFCTHHGVLPPLDGARGIWRLESSGSRLIIQWRLWQFSDPEPLIAHPTTTTASCPRRLFWRGARGAEGRS